MKHYLLIPLILLGSLVNAQKVKISTATLQKTAKLERAIVTAHQIAQFLPENYYATPQLRNGLGTHAIAGVAHKEHKDQKGFIVDSLLLNGKTGKIQFLLIPDSSAKEFGLPKEGIIRFASEVMYEKSMVMFFVRESAVTSHDDTTLGAWLMHGMIYATQHVMGKRTTMTDSEAQKEAWENTLIAWRGAMSAPARAYFDQLSSTISCTNLRQQVVELEKRTKNGPFAQMVVMNACLDKFLKEVFGNLTLDSK